MFKDSVILKDLASTYQHPESVPGGFIQTVTAIPNWLQKYRSYVNLLGFTTEYFDESDWLPEVWAPDKTLDTRYAPAWFAMQAVAGYKYRSQTQIARNRPFVNTPLDAEQLKLVHPLLRDSLPMLVGFSQSLWANRQSCYFMVAEQEKDDGIWEHERAFFVDSPWRVYLMAKLDKIKQYKIQGSNSLIDELVNYPKKRGPKASVIRAQEKATVLARYDKWLDVCAEVRQKREAIKQQIAELNERKRELQDELASIKAPPFVR